MNKQLAFAALGAILLAVAIVSLCQLDAMEVIKRLHGG